MTFMVQPISTK